ncbi:MAG TPA: hypothetical protein PKW30_01590 [Campylobacterales bacterium]|nr:hypothetical protein [Campylobacterales bacterium]
MENQEISFEEFLRRNIKAVNTARISYRDLIYFLLHPTDSYTFPIEYLLRLHCNEEFKSAVSVHYGHVWTGCLRQAHWQTLEFPCLPISQYKF